MSRLTWLAGLGLLATAALAAPVSLITLAPEKAAVVAGSTPFQFAATGLYADSTTGRLGNATLGAGGNHTCSVVHSGGVRCWGQNGLGELGSSPAVTQSAVPLSVPTVASATAVAGGFQFTCAVLTGGSVRCWGAGTSGQLGNGGLVSTSTPVSVSGISNVISVGAGFQHACALLSTGGVRCWGENGKGQLGNASTTDSSIPVPVSGITTAIGLTVGGDSACAVIAGGGVRCWGANNVGQLGNGSLLGSSTPVEVSGISTAVAAGAGFDFNCALLGGGALRCWGEGRSGQLGNGALASSSTPVAVTLPGEAIAVAAGLSHTCAVLKDDTVQCWGSNGNGQLGNGTIVGTFPSPAGVPGIDDAITVTAGFSHTCASLKSGAVRCWGINSEGQVGAGVTYPRTGSPVDVNGTATAIEAGYNHNCVVLPSGRVACWGGNQFGQTGQPPPAVTTVVPVIVFGLTDVVDLGLGLDHGCAVLASGLARCWGRNNDAQLGVGSLEPVQTSQPLNVFGLSTAARISAGVKHTCAVLTDGTVQCWGRNEFGQVAYTGGTGITVGFPVTVPGITTAVDVSVGAEHSCALLSTGSVSCWGRGLNGRLGNGGTANSNTPVAVSFITTATAVSAGTDHTCVRLAAREIRCWGANTRGQLGTGSTVQPFFSTPVNAINDDFAIDISSGREFGCMLATPVVRCFGRGTDGQIGNNAFVDRSDAQTVPIGLASAVSAGQAHACALLNDGSLRCWGDNTFGQLGQGTAFGTSSALPVQVPGITLDAVALFWNAGAAGATAARSGHVWFDDDGENATFVTAFYGLSGAEGPILRSGADSDGDGVIDQVDNCVNVPNADQRDTNQDGFGNICDADLNNSLLVTTADFAIMRSVLNQSAGSSATAADADMNGSGTVTTGDVALFRVRINTVPGPSGHACAGTIPCP